jgi:ornithine carbamoyltransferase
MKKDLITIYDLTKAEIETILRKSARLKEMLRQGTPYQPLTGKTLAMIFEKPSTRTRVSFETGMFQLGGHALSLNPQETQLGRGEAIADTARVLSRYCDGILIRTFAQERIEEMARFATIPVINGLSDLLHPCQILSDIFTMTERLGHEYGRLKVAYVGDGNNVANSWINGALRLGFELWLACPPGYEPNAKILSRGQAEGSSKIILTSDPREAVDQAHVINTEVWASMGQEGERAKRQKAFKGYQVNADLVRRARKDAIVMHCLPAHRGEEITDEVMDGPHSAVFDQAENRLHVQKAILTLLMGKGESDEKGG